ncbi:hypothetical protein ABT187_41910 [Streptomyces sp. NPDC001817]|uniref:hypothetical protein n=1 Tax=Streptomyces sp. NPDC001817 TaxID=3154398 RepID=UPI00331E6086
MARPWAGRTRLRRCGPRTEHIRRFGECPSHELADEPGVYDPHLDVEFTPIRGDRPPTDRSSQAA